MATRTNVRDYKSYHRDNKLTDLVIEMVIGMASRKIDVLMETALSAEVLQDAELLLALYFGTAEDRRKTSEGIPPASTTYETVSYLDLLRVLLGDAYALLGNLDGPVLKNASIMVITPNV